MTNSVLLFQNAAFLAALAAVAVPVLLHLVFRRKARTLPFPDLRFLRAVDQRVSRRHRIEEWLLLAVRMGLLALLALGLARPLWRSDGVALGAGPATAAVFLLDDSYSLGFAASGGAPAFERARAAALAALAQLHAGDTVALLTINRPPPAGRAELSADRVAARSALAGLAPSAGGSNLAPARGRAADLLAAAKAARRELYLFTDLQKSSWEAALAAGGRRERLRDVDIVLVDVGAPAGANLALSGVAVAATHEIRGMPARISAVVENHGDAEAASTLALLFDGRRLAERAVVVPPHGALAVTLLAPCEGVGFHHGEVRLDDDALAADNRRRFVLDVRERIRVLIVNGARSPVPHQDAAWYLTKALQPAIAGDSGRSIIAPTVCSPAELGDYQLADFAVLILAEVAELPPDRLAAVTAFVENGGGLLLLPGPATDPARFTRTFATRDAWGGLLPAPVTGIRGEPEARAEFTVIREVNERHPIFAALAGAEPPVDLGT
ncbi:MAG: BatA domain-containing protein, partial [Planctomycetes bacterium]|nr:BatA domain-containing protein [Planctomycetota bacterium]